MESLISEAELLESIEKNIFKCYMKLADLDISNKKNSVEYNRIYKKLNKSIILEKDILKCKYTNCKVNTEICHNLDNMLNDSSISDEKYGVYSRMLYRLIPLSDYYMDLYGDVSYALNDFCKICNVSEIVDPEEYKNYAMKYKEDNIKMDLEISYIKRDIYEELLFYYLSDKTDSDLIHGKKIMEKYYISFNNPLLEESYLEEYFNEIPPDVIKFRTISDEENCKVFYKEEFEKIITTITQFMDSATLEYKDEFDELLVELEVLLRHGYDFLKNSLNNSFTERYKNDENCSQNREKILSLIKKYKKE